MLFLLLCASCSKYPTKTYIIASQKGAIFSQYNYWQSYFFVKEKGENEWQGVETMLGMEYELGYEYVVEGVLKTSRDFYEEGVLDATSIITVERVISKTQKTTQLPDEKLWAIEKYWELLNSGQLPYEDRWNSGY